MIHHLLLYGWIENSSCQAGEHCHRWFLKLIKHLTNNKVEWEKQLFNVHTREETLQAILASVSKCLVYVLVYAVYVVVYSVYHCILYIIVYFVVYSVYFCILVYVSEGWLTNSKQYSN